MYLLVSKAHGTLMHFTRTSHHATQGEDMSASTFRTERPTPGAPVIAHHAPAPVPAPAAGTGVVRYPSLTTTVPKEFVHRASVAEVLLTDWERTDDTRFTVSAQWPRGHSFFTAVDGFHDPLIAAETIRQASTLLAHTEFGIPLGHHFLMWDLTVRVHPEQLLVGTAPASVQLDITCSDLKRRGNQLTGGRNHMVLRRDGKKVATGSASYTSATPAVYRRLRQGRTLDSGRPPLPLTAPVAPQSVGRMSPRDVVLSPAGQANRWQLRVDTRHPVLFDHPVDHIPGMMLIEAARQATAATLKGSFLPLSLDSSFDRYAELDAPCLIEAHPAPADTESGEQSVLVTGHQHGEAVFRSHVRAAAHTT
jgi:hypothetical protein